MGGGMFVTGCSGGKLICFFFGFYLNANISNLRNLQIAHEYIYFTQIAEC